MLIVVDSGPVLNLAVDAVTKKCALNFNMIGDVRNFKSFYPITLNNYLINKVLEF